MRNLACFIQPLSKAAVKHLLAMAGINTKKAMHELAATGSTRLTADAKITYCSRRYQLIDEGSCGGASIAPLLAEGLQAALPSIPAAQEDQDGTFAQRQADESKRDAIVRTRHLLLHG